MGEDQSGEEIREVKKEISMKHFTLLLVAVLVFNSVAVPQATQTQGASPAAKVKAEVQKRGIGEKSRVKVRLRNKTEVKGYISKIGAKIGIIAGAAVVTVAVVIAVAVCRAGYC